MNGSTHSTLIVDDHEMILSGIEEMVKRIYPITTIYTEKTVCNAKKRFKKQNINLLISDLSMDEYLSGVEFIKQVKDKNPDLKIVIYSMHDTPSIIKVLYDIGINAYITKQSQTSELKTAIQKVCSGDHYFSPDVVQIIESRKQPDGHIPVFTQREKEIIALMKTGKSSVQIARQLRITKNTVESHRKHIFNKASVKNMAELIAFAVENNILK